MMLGAGPVPDSVYSHHHSEGRPLRSPSLAVGPLPHLTPTASDWVATIHEVIELTDMMSRVSPDGRPLACVPSSWATNGKVDGAIGRLSVWHRPRRPGQFIVAGRQARCRCKQNLRRRITVRDGCKDRIKCPSCKMRRLDARWSTGPSNRIMYFSFCPSMMDSALGADYITRTVRADAICGDNRANAVKAK
jgi:hypothetical protein